MTPRISLLFAAGTACIASTAAAQDAGADYANDDYVIAVPVEMAEPEVVGIQVLSEEQTDRQAVTPATRVIPARQPQPVDVVYSQTPTIQPVVTNCGYEYSVPSGNPMVQPAQPVQQPVYTAQGQQQVPVYYAYPVGSPTGQPMAYGQRGQYALPPGAQVVTFDRATWLRQCDERLATYETQDRGKALGAIGGAVAGGVIGNRVAGRGDRLLGTVIGAGAGAATGGVIGDAIDDGQTRRISAYAECEAYLNDYMQSAMAGTLDAQPGYYGQQYMLVPVQIMVPQQAIYRDVE